MAMISIHNSPCLGLSLCSPRKSLPPPLFSHRRKYRNRPVALFPNHSQTSTEMSPPSPKEDILRRFFENRIGHVILSKKLFVAAASLALSFSLLGSGVDSYALVSSTSRRLQSDEVATVKLFRENTPSVVYITNLAVRYVYFFDSMRGLIFYTVCILSSLICSYFFLELT